MDSLRPPAALPMLLGLQVPLTEIHAWLKEHCEPGRKEKMLHKMVEMQLKHRNHFDSEQYLPATP